MSAQGRDLADAGMQMALFVKPDWKVRAESVIQQLAAAGNPFTADDVLFSLDRPAALVGSPGPFTSYTRQIVAKDAPDRHTVRLKTAKAYGPLPLDLSSIFIVSKKAAQHASNADFNSGKAAIGSGPYRVARHPEDQAQSRQ